MKREYDDACKRYEEGRRDTVHQDTLFIDMRMEGNTVYFPRMILLRLGERR